MANRASVNAVSKNGGTPLHACSQGTKINGIFDIARVLIKNCDSNNKEKTAVSMVGL
jgi:hypothetical protein